MEENDQLRSRTPKMETKIEKITVNPADYETLKQQIVDYQYKIEVNY